jgi:hypothetical protein
MSKALIDKPGSSRKWMPVEKEPQTERAASKYAPNAFDHHFPRWVQNPALSAPNILNHATLGWIHKGRSGGSIFIRG